MTILPNRVIRVILLLFVTFLVAALAQNGSDNIENSTDEGKNFKIKATVSVESVVDVDDGTIMRKGHLDATDLFNHDLEKLTDLTFQFFSNEKEHAFKHVESDATKRKGDKVWYGEDDDYDEVNILQTESGQIFGSVTTAEAIYQFHTTTPGGGLMEFKEILTDDFPPEMDLDDSEDESEDEEEYRELLRGGRAQVAIANGSGERRLEDDGSVIDVIVVYTKEAMCMVATGERSTDCREDHVDVLGLIDDMFQETNQAFKNSKINAQVNLVHAYMDPDYVEGGNFKTYLHDLKDRNDGVLEGVHEKRNQYAADLVTLIVSHGNACGVSHKSLGRASRGFNVVNQRCAVGHFSFAHEVGHNLGCNHNIEDSSKKEEFPAYGHRDDAARVRSIMGAKCSPKCKRIQYFSNPEITVKGKSFGTSEANNAAQINSMLHTVANFRKSSMRVADSATPTALPPMTSPLVHDNLDEGDTHGNGIMFDVEALSGDLKVIGMEVNLYTDDEAKIEVYTKHGDYKSKPRKGWKLVGEAMVSGEGYGKAVSLPPSIFSDGVLIKDGQVRGFWVVSPTKVVVISKSEENEGTTIASDSIIAITSGRSTNYDEKRNPPFSEVKYPYEFNGSVSYGEA